MVGYGERKKYNLRNNSRYSTSKNKIENLPKINSCSIAIKYKLTSIIPYYYYLYCRARLPSRGHSISNFVCTSENTSSCSGCVDCSRRTTQAPALFFRFGVYLVPHENGCDSTDIPRQLHFHPVASTPLYSRILRIYISTSPNGSLRTRG